MKKIFITFLFLISIFCNSSFAIIMTKVQVSGASATEIGNTGGNGDPGGGGDYTPPGGGAVLIDIPIPNQVASFINDTTYDPTEISNLYLPPNSGVNEENTYYVDGTNGSDSYTGLCAFKDPDSECGPFRNIGTAQYKYGGHRYGERILIKSGFYPRTSVTAAEGFTWSNLSGINDENHVMTIGPYGDGEVVIDLSFTSELGTFTTFTGNIWKSDIGAGFAFGRVDWAVMDYVYNSCRKAIGYTATDNSGVNNKTTSLIDYSKNFGRKTILNNPNTIVYDTNFIGAIVWNITDGSHGVVTSVSTTTNTNDTLNFSGGLTGGTDNDFDNGDQYAAYIMDADGKFVNVGGKFYIVSTSGSPTTRNLIANPDDSDTSFVPFYIGQAPKFKAYGLTFLGAPSNAIWYLYGAAELFEIEKCRFLFLGKSAINTTYAESSTIKLTKNFIYSPTMLNWPRGRTYYGSGGWPNGVGGGGVYGSFADGNIIMYSGGEGIGYYDTIKNNIIYNPFSVAYYPAGRADRLNLYNNVGILDSVHYSDMWEPFYLDEGYFGTRRTYNKIFPQGLFIASENSPTDVISNAYFYNNVLIGFSTGISYLFENSPAAAFDHTSILNNLVVLPDYQIYNDTFNDGEILGLNGIIVGIKIRADAPLDNDSYLRNNIIIGSTNTDGQHQLLDVDGSDYSAWQINNNMYSFPANPTFVQDNNLFNKMSFSTWKSTTGYDSNSILTDTPLLTRTDFSDVSIIIKSDLTLQGTSLAVDAGLDLSGTFTTDYNGTTRPIGSGWDIGAFESY